MSGARAAGLEFVDDALVDRMVDAENANLEARLRSYSGVFIERFGDAIAFTAPDIPVRLFNSVLGTSDATLEHFDDIFARYKGRGLVPSFEVVPSRHSPAIGQAMLERGLPNIEQHVGMAGALAGAQPVPEGAVLVERCELDEVFLDTYLRAWGARDPEGAKPNLRGWVKNETWRFYLARVDGEPAGAAVLDLQGETAVLGSAGTLSEARGKGVQAALIARRIHDAAAAGCELVIGGAYEGSSSARNQQRGGLQVAFTRSIYGPPTL